MLHNKIKANICCSFYLMTAKFLILKDLTSIACSDHTFLSSMFQGFKIHVY